MSSEASRLTAWNAASDLVDPIIEKHGIENTKVGPMFGVASVDTKVDQHIDAIMRVADWILGDNK